MDNILKKGYSEPQIFLTEFGKEDVVACSGTNQATFSQEEGYGFQIGSSFFD